MRLPSAVLLATVLILGGCAAPSKDLIVLLPDKEGKVGTVVVQNPRGNTVLNSAYAAARSTPDGGVQRDTASQNEVKEVFNGALTAQPPRPISFMLYFESGTDEFTEQSKLEVKRLLAEMARRQAPDISVIGHTDLVGSNPSNDALSLQRAERVKSILVGMGIPAERILTAGRGRREPLVPSEDGIPEPRNRRVEISVR
jgi:outer membrane protein OmpA-like peptidoglycan-associated protein